MYEPTFIYMQENFASFVKIYTCADPENFTLSFSRGGGVGTPTLDQRMIYHHNISQFLTAKLRYTKSAHNYAKYRCYWLATSASFAYLCPFLYEMTTGT